MLLICIYAEGLCKSAEGFCKLAEGIFFSGKASADVQKGFASLRKTLTRL